MTVVTVCAHPEFKENAFLGRKLPTQFRTLSVLMPIFNERYTLRKIVRKVLDTRLELGLELICVDDGSTDGSWERLQELAEADPRISIYRHARNQGKGAAIRTAIEHMTGDVAVIQDADLEHNPADYHRPLAPILEGKADAELGHYRRYSEEQLRTKMTAAGFEVVHAERFNRFGALGWWVSGNILRRRDLTPRQMIWFDRLLPLAKLMERVLPWPGMSLIVVGRKRDREIQAGS